MGACVCMCVSVCVCVCVCLCVCVRGLVRFVLFNCRHSVVQVYVLLKLEPNAKTSCCRASVNLAVGSSVHVRILIYPGSCWLKRARCILQNTLASGGVCLSIWIIHG